MFKINLLNISLSHEATYTHGNERKMASLEQIVHLIPPFENNIRQRGTSIIVINAERSGRNASQAFNQIT